MLYVAPPYEIIQEHDFAERLDAITDKELLERIERAIFWALYTNPSALPMVPGFATIRYLPVTNWKDVSCIVLFRLDGISIYLLWLEPS